MTADEVANTLHRFVGGEGDPWDWDDFVSVPLREPELEQIRLRCLQLDKEFPPQTLGAFCGPGGIDIVKDYVQRLRSGSWTE